MTIFTRFIIMIWWRVWQLFSNNTSRVHHPVTSRPGPLCLTTISKTIESKMSKKDLSILLDRTQCQCHTNSWLQVSDRLVNPLNVQIAWKIVLCTTEQTFGILYQKKLGKASHFIPFEIKSLLTLVLGNLCKYNLPVNNSKHLLYLLNLYITVNSLAYHYHILHVK
jgi:hypothetical protein